jgi:putative hydrolase of the HAD superfamily
MADRERMCAPVTRRPSIRAVLFDLGGTLEDVYFDDAWRLQATRGFRDILAQHNLDPGLTIPELYATLKTGMEQYQTWREESERELPPERVWGKYVFTNHNLPQEELAAIGEELAFYWDTRFSRRALRPEVPALLDALRARGFRLGVISNITSRESVPHQLTQYGIRDCFQVVLASSVFGWRKPSPRIFLEATRQLNLAPAECAYVGDTVSRDVIGARRAGYGLVIQIKSFLTARSDRETDVEPPDAVVENLMQVIALVSYESILEK